MIESFGEAPTIQTKQETDIITVDANKPNQINKPKGPAESVLSKK
jgi:hypothetical protein